MSILGRDRRGFTLLELLVVIALISVIAALVVPSVTSYFQISINSATRDLATTVKEAYNSTVLTGRVYRVVYDLKTNSYWVESGPPTVLLDTSESRAKEQYKRLHDVKRKHDNVFSMDRTITRKHVSLPRGVVFQDVITQESKDPIKHGRAYTHFFPQGMTEQTIIHLKDSSHHHVSLVISALVGDTTVWDHYVTLEQAFGKK